MALAWSDIHWITGTPTIGKSIENTEAQTRGEPEAHLVGPIDLPASAFGLRYRPGHRWRTSRPHVIGCVGSEALLD